MTSESLEEQLVVARQEILKLRMENLSMKGMLDFSKLVIAWVLYEHKKTLRINAGYLYQKFQGKYFIDNQTDPNTGEYVLRLIAVNELGVKEHD